MCCRRCGIEKPAARDDDKLLSWTCNDCQRSQVKVIKYKIDGVEGACRPWQGNFDDEDYPLNRKGERFTGEVALCGHRDCVTTSHRPEMVFIPRVAPIPRKKNREFSMEMFLATAEARGQL